MEEYILPASPAYPERQWRRRVVRMESPGIAIVIISADRRRILEETLAILTGRMAGYPGGGPRIVVVEPDERPLTDRGIEHIVPPPAVRGNFAALRNFALARAAADLTLFLDDDAWPEPGWFDALTAPLLGGEAVAAGGGAVHQPGGPIGRAVTLLGVPAGGLARILRTGGERVETRLLSTLNCAFRTAAVEAIGGFDERLVHGGEDQDLFERLAREHRVVFVPSALVRHRQRDSLSAVWSWYRRRGRAEYTRLRRAAGRSRSAALLSPLTGSITLRLVGLALPPIGLGMEGILVDAALLLLHAAGTVARTLWRHRRGGTELSPALEEIRRDLLAWPVLALLPLVKWTADAGFETGRWQGWHEEPGTRGRAT